MSTFGFACAVTAAVLFGVGGTFAQFLFENRGINLQWLVSMRLLGGGTILLIFAAARDGHAVLAPLRDRKDAIQLLLFGVLGMLSVQYTYFAAIKESNTATATVMQYTAPAMIAVWMAMRSRRWPSGKEYAAIALAMTGTFFLVTHGNFSALSITGIALFWGIASAVAAAFNSIQPAGLLHKYSAAYVTGWGMLIGGIALSFVHQPWNVEGVFDTTTYIFITFILLFGSLAAFYLYLKAVRLIAPQYTSLLSCAEPLSAAVLAVMWLGVSFGAMDWLGTVLILATIVLLAKKQTADTQSEKVT